MKLIISAEHGGNLIPEDYKFLFNEHDHQLATHRGYDPGTEDLFHYLEDISAFAKLNTTSRLLIEFNRSLHHRNLFSVYSKKLSKNEQKSLIEAYYLPYRNVVEEHIKNEILNKNKVLHISLHSFTPQLGEQIRTNDIGLLYDPKRATEKEITRTFKEELNKLSPEIKIRFNYPYLGSADGFTTYLRKIFPENYIGIELEINQKWVKNGKFPQKLKTDIKTVLSYLVN